MFVQEDGVLAALLWHDHITYNSLIKTHSPMLKDFTAVTTINFRNLSSLPTGTPCFAYHQPNLHSHSQPPTCSSFCTEWCIMGHIYIKTCLPCSFTEWLISRSITPSWFFFVVTSTTTGGETWNSFFLEVSNFFLLYRHTTWLLSAYELIDRLPSPSYYEWCLCAYANSTQPCVFISPAFMPGMGVARQPSVCYSTRLTGRLQNFPLLAAGCLFPW